MIQKICPKCRKTYPGITEFCTECGTKLIEKVPNKCSDPNCLGSKTVFDDKQKFCGRCGSPTTYWKESEKSR